MDFKVMVKKGLPKIYKVFKSFVISDTLLCKSYFTYNVFLKRPL